MITQEDIQRHHDTCENNKKKWGEGQWTKEENRREWIHNGMQCLAVRQPELGHWCGYVGLKPGHKYYGINDSRSYFDEDGEIKRREDQKDEVYAFELGYGPGGTTYGNFCQGPVCHVTDNEEEKLYWLGFDCAHCDDVSPYQTVLDKEFGYGKWKTDATYKELNWVVEQVNVMADELKDG